MQFVIKTSILAFERLLIRSSTANKTTINNFFVYRFSNRDPLNRQRFTNSTAQLSNPGNSGFASLGTSMNPCMCDNFFPL